MFEPLLRFQTCLYPHSLRPLDPDSALEYGSGSSYYKINVKIEIYYDWRVFLNMKVHFKVNFIFFAKVQLFSHNLYTFYVKSKHFWQSSVISRHNLKKKLFCECFLLRISNFVETNVYVTLLGEISLFWRKFFILQKFLYYQQNTVAN